MLRAPRTRYKTPVLLSGCRAPPSAPSRRRGSDLRLRVGTLSESSGPGPPLAGDWQPRAGGPPKHQVTPESTLPSSTYPTYFGRTYYYLGSNFLHI